MFAVASPQFSGWLGGNPSPRNRERQTPPAQQIEEGTSAEQSGREKHLRTQKSQLTEKITAARRTADLYKGSGRFKPDSWVKAKVAAEKARDDLLAQKQEIEDELRDLRRKK